jgi:hypothetical protein
MPQPDQIDVYPAKYDGNDFAFKKNETIELIGEFFHATDYLRDALSLGFEFSRRSPETLPELLHKIRERLVFERDDDLTGFFKQHTVMDLLINGLSTGDKLLSTCFYEVAKTYLGFSFTYSTGGRNYTIHLITIGLPNSNHIQELRRKIWEALDSNKDKFPGETRAVLKSYTESGPDVIPEVATFDLSYVLHILHNGLRKDSLKDCMLVYDLIRWFERNEVSHPDFGSIAEDFTNEKYQAYLKIDWNRLRDKEVFDFTNHDEYEKIKEAEIRASFTFSSTDAAQGFYEDFVEIRKVSQDPWSYNRSMDIVIDTNLQSSIDIGISLLKRIIENDNEIGFVPLSSFRNFLKNESAAKSIWTLVSTSRFKDRFLWQMRFFEYLDDSLINPEYTGAIVNAIEAIDEDSVILFGGLRRYLQIDPELFKTIVKVVVAKNKAGQKISCWHDLFEVHFFALGSDAALIREAYMQQENIQNHFDYEGKGFFNVLSMDKSFLLEYIVNLQAKSERGLSSLREDLSVVWQIDEIERELRTVFDTVSDAEPFFGIGEHFCNCFFRNLDHELKDRPGRFLIRYLEENIGDQAKVNMVVDIARHTMKSLYQDVVLKHLSLSQDVTLFKKIWWRGNGGTVHSGSVNMGDLRASEWRTLMSIVEKSDVGLSLVPIKRYIAEEIDLSIRYGDSERQRRFLQRG